MKKKKEKKTKYVYTEFSIRIDEYYKRKLDILTERYKISRNELINRLLHHVLLNLQFNDDLTVASYGELDKIIGYWETEGERCAPKYDEKIKK